MTPEEQAEYDRWAYYEEMARAEEAEWNRAMEQQQEDELIAALNEELAEFIPHEGERD